MVVFTEICSQHISVFFGLCLFDHRHHLIKVHILVK